MGSRKSRGRSRSNRLPRGNVSGEGDDSNIGVCNECGADRFAITGDDVHNAGRKHLVGDFAEE